MRNIGLDDDDPVAWITVQPDPPPPPLEYAMTVMESNGEIVEQFTIEEMTRLAKIWRRQLDAFMPGLDVERLATVLRGAYVKGPGYTLGLGNDADKWADIIAAEYDRLGDKP